MAACSARLKTFDVKTGKHRLSGVPSNSPKSGQWSVKSWHFTIIHLSDQLMLHITELSTFPSTLMIFDPCFINSLILNQSSVVGTYSLFNLACSFFFATTPLTIVISIFALFFFVFRLSPVPTVSPFVLCFRLCHDYLRFSFARNPHLHSYLFPFYSSPHPSPLPRQSISALTHPPHSFE